MYRNRIYLFRMQTPLKILGLSIIISLGFTFSSLAQGPSQVINLESSADITFIGRAGGEAVHASAPGTILGQLRVIAADVTGDGVDDLILGLPFADVPPEVPRTNAGAVYIIFGDRNVFSGTIRDLQFNPPDVIVYGANVEDFLGISLATGDFNGDGIKDVLIGAPLADESNRPNVGNAYVLFGGASLRQTRIRDMRSTTAPSRPDVKIIGWGGPANKDGVMDDRDEAGTAVAGGDVNGDGIDDMVIGAPGLDGNNGDRTTSGAVYVFFGQRPWPSNRATLDASTGLPTGVNIVIYGRASTRNIPTVGLISIGGEFGHAVTVCDVNGDGVGDIIGSAPTTVDLNTLEISGGEVYVFYGSRALPTSAATVFDVETRSNRRYVNAPPNFTVFGADTGDAIGRTLTCGNLSGDRFADIVIGSDSAAGPGNMRSGSGEVYVITGAGTLSDRKLAEAPANVTIQGARPRDQLGFSIAVGDINGDGIEDLLLGTPIAPSSTDQFNLTGRANILYGGTSLMSRPQRDLAQTNNQPEMIINGATFADQVGFSVAAGDMNGDGTRDIIMTSPFADSPLDGQKRKAGATYVVFGRRF